MPIVPVLIALSAILGSIPVFMIAYLYRYDRVVPVGRRAFWAMGFGLWAIGGLYVGIAILGTSMAFVPYSRLMWLFIIGVTVAMSVSVLVYRRSPIELDEKREHG